MDEADAKVTETRSRLYREVNEYMQSWDQELGRPHLRSNTQIERIVNLVAGWFSLEEMKVLQGVSVLTTCVWAREWQYKDILNDTDGLAWGRPIGRWAKNTCPREVKVLPCEVRSWSSTSSRAKKPNRCATEVSASLTKSSKIHE